MGFNSNSPPTIKKFSSSVGSKIEPSFGMDLGSNAPFGRCRRASCPPLTILDLPRKTSSNEMKMIIFILGIFGANFRQGIEKTESLRASGLPLSYPLRSMIS